ncbi:MULTISPECIES: response regulator transcription factor [Streptomycetaceae]|uniref:Two-component system response regulator n=1 Tax=Streptantibioticus cattleyicolor (strain ATCC 35852 / DSM 46488 / JCM 4925 / NBRC 14057 / NRRL 8057) TaxID=1003195 RepID=F8K2E9_STREN|nr:MULTISPECIES: response regulator transcription factor [Streptomycetaceae]AEW96241.1 two-component system response regulator [Streptantibioticus cattleyicolor NRRL 8057 = DSM 46488]MYS60761.1 response regulator [Streptomyces sp. SID5468]CCB76580.1 Two-component system response regulator [Streptantibioticus cattleyicolor NRRL 8057 = DSM 46488]
MTTPGTLPRPLRVVVADDNPVVRAGLGALLTARPGIEVVAEAADGRQAYEAAAAHRPDLVLLDVRMPGTDGLAALPGLARIAPVLMLTWRGEPGTVREAIRRGAGGYLVHGEFTADQLVAAVRDTSAGRAALTTSAATALLAEVRGGTGEPEPDRARFRLSRREAEVMELIAGGLNNRQIAAACFISEKTVKNHVNRIFGKLHADSRSQAVARWLGTAR